MPEGGPNVRIAMWSGPRNISTALLRAWGNRPDTFVCDEPLYAHYLLETRLAHPGAEEVIARHEADWRKVVTWLTGPIPDQRSVFYQKHMAHHLLPSIERDWLDRVTNAFLIREPREMLASLARILPEPTLSDTGLPQQVEVFRQVRLRTGRVPPVIDSRDVLMRPRPVLGQLCAALGVELTAAMLSWPPGLRATDGVWAKHWYDSVARSTGFQPYQPVLEPLAERLEPLAEECRLYFRELHEHRLTGD